MDDAQNFGVRGGPYALFSRTALGFARLGCDGKNVSRSRVMMIIILLL